MGKEKRDMLWSTTPSNTNLSQKINILMQLIFALLLFYKKHKGSEMF